MNQLSIFKILTYVLIPFALLFAFMDLLFILSAFANPAILLVAFLFSAFVIYVFTSLKFFRQSIQKGIPSKSALKDWIKVNAYVSLFLGSIFFINSLSIFFTADLTLRQYLANFLENQPNIPSALNLELFLTIMKAMAWFMFIMSAVLLNHIFINFRLLQKYRDLFVENR